jgi:hypothetical protein
MQEQCQRSPFHLGTGSSNVALAKLGCYSILTWWILNRLIVNEQLRSNTGPYEV